MNEVTLIIRSKLKRGDVAEVSRRTGHHPSYICKMVSGQIEITERAKKAFLAIFEERRETEEKLKNL